MFKDIEKYEGLYQVSSCGSVRALPRTVVNKNGNSQKYPGKVLKQEITSDGRCRVTLSMNHKTKRFLVHRLLAKAFIPNPNNKPDINHIDNNPLNNIIENLEWCTHPENMIHAQKQSRLFAAQSKGGKNRGIAGKKADAIIQSMAGKTFNNWYVLSFACYKGSKKYFNVKCTCGNITVREQSYLRTYTQNGCIKCKTRL